MKRPGRAVGPWCAFLLVGGALAGCVDPAGAPLPDGGGLPDGGVFWDANGPDAGPPVLRVGTSLDGGFVPFADGGTLGIVHGIQGGIHVEVAVEGQRIPFEGATLLLTGTDATTGEVLCTSVCRTLGAASVDVSGDAWVRPGERLIFFDVDPALYVGRTLLVEAVVVEPGQSCFPSAGAAIWTDSAAGLLYDTAP